MANFTSASLMTQRSSACNAGHERDENLIPDLRRSPGGGNGNLLQYSCLENSMDREAWQAAVHGVTKSRIRLSDRTHTHTHRREMQWKPRPRQVPEKPNGLRPVIQRKIYVQESFPFSLNLPYSSCTYSDINFLIYPDFPISFYRFSGRL